MREGTKDIVIGFLLVLLTIVTLQMFNYHRKVNELESQLFTSAKLGYEALVRYSYLDGYRVYKSLHQDEYNEEEFLGVIKKSDDSNNAYLKYLYEIGYRDRDLAELIAKEKTDFLDVLNGTWELHAKLEKERK